MNRATLVLLLAPATLFSQSLIMSRSVSSIPMMEYSPLASIGRLEGDIDLSIQLLNGAIKKIEARALNPKLTGADVLVDLAIRFGNKIIFHSSENGEILLHFSFRVRKPSAPIIEKETYISFEPLRNKILVETTAQTAIDCH